MRKLLSTIVLFIWYLCVHGQTIFEKKFTPSTEQYGREIFQTADGGFFLQGTIEKAWRNCTLIRTDSMGDTLWTRTYGTDSTQYFVYDMAKAADGSYLMCGDYQTQLTYPSMDSYIQKVDSNGNQIWFNLFGWPWSQGGSKDHGRLVRTLKNKDIIVEGMTKDYYISLGNYYPYNYTWRSYLAKFDDSTGDCLAMTDVCLKIDSNFFGGFHSYDMETINSKIYLLGIPLSKFIPTAGHNMLVILNSNLDTVFTIRTALDTYYGLSKTADNHLLLMGDGIISKMDTLGNIVWTSINSSPSKPYKLIEISDGNLVSIGGNQFVSIWVGDFYGIYDTIVYINKYTPSGSLIWSRGFSLPPFVKKLLGYNIVETHDKGFAFVGYSDDDIWMVKTDSLGNFNTSVPKKNLITQSISIYPNPFSSQTTLWSSYRFENAIIAIYNSFGMQVKQISNVFGNTICLNRENLPSGVYFLRISQLNKNVSIGKFVIMNE